MKKVAFICASMLCAIITSFSQTIIQGTVSEHKSGESIPYIYIKNISQNTGAGTDINGHFSIEAKAGEDSLKLVGAGYEDLVVIASEGINIRMKQSALILDEVVISTNREQERRTESPIAITSVSSQTIEDNKPNTIDEVLNQTPGVNMVAFGGEQHAMSIRGPIAYGAYYLYLEDGVPIRTSGVFNHNALLEINMANTSKIEIIRGPASSSYGSEAIGGAVNFISKRPSAVPTAGVSLRANNIGYKRTDFYASSTIKKKLGLRFSGYYANQRDGVISYSDFDKLALSLTANYLLTDHSELTWNNSFVDYYADMSGSLDSTDFYSGSYGSVQTFTNREVNAFRSKLSYNHYWNDDSKTTVTGYFRNNSIKQNPSYRVSDDYKPWLGVGDANLAHGQVNDNSFNSYGVIAQHKWEFDWLNGSLVAGASMDYSPNTYQANYISINKTDEGIYDSFTMTDSLLADYSANLFNIGAYSQLKLQPVKGLNVIGALRYDRFNYDFDNHLGANAYTAVLDGKDVFSRLTPKIGVTYDLKKNRGVYANYGQGFVPPQVTELYRGNDVPVLKPVYYSNMEVGGWVALAKEKVRLEVSLYKMDGLNEIISVLQDDGTSVKENAGKTTHQGVEYGLTYVPHKDVLLKVSGTNAIHEFVEFNEGGVDLSGNEMPLAPSFIGNVQVTYKPSYVKGLKASLEWRFIDKYYMNQDNSKEYEGFNVFNARVSYEIKSFEVWLNLMNATNKLYATVASASAWGQSYSLGNPRSLNLGVAYNFKKK